MDIAILDDYQGVALELADWSRLQSQGRVDAFHDHVAGEESLVTRLAPYQAVVLMRERTPLPANVICRLPELRLVVFTGRRNPAVDVDEAARRGVVVSHTGGSSASAAELTWALVLAVSRNLLDEAASVAGGGWQTTVGRDLAGLTLGVLGLGRLGTKVAGYARAFDMDVVAWSRSLDAVRATELGVTAAATLEDLLPRCDVVTVHLPLTDQTRGLVGRGALGLMRPGAVLVNTSRGPIVDSAALREALLAGRIAGAAVDVFDEEPLAPDDPLRTTPGLLATPHIGYVTTEVMRTFYREAVEDVEAFLQGAPIRVVPPSTPA